MAFMRDNMTEIVDGVEHPSSPFENDKDTKSSASGKDHPKIDDQRGNEEESGDAENVLDEVEKEFPGTIELVDSLRKVSAPLPPSQVQ
jgi:hypothetical protein